MPHADDLELLSNSSAPDDLLNVRSQAYDLVLNGWELGRAAFVSTDETSSNKSLTCWA